MDKKQLKINRKKGYFVESTKQIIDQEGIESLSVKKIANRAGFAAGTLYNYFNDMNHLLQHVLLDYFDECITVVENSMTTDNITYETIENAFMVYSDYFINHPNAFNLIFLKDVGAMQGDVKDNLLNPKVNIFFHQLLQKYFNNQMSEENNLEIIELSVANMIHGSLLFYLKGRTTYDEQTFKHLLRNQLKYILK
jgi:AcrR family transcriptional regulator